MHTKKHLGFSGLRKILSKRFLQGKDNRDTGKIDHRLHDFFMSAFAMMYFQDPSLLAFQRKLQNSTNLNNLKTMFDVTSIPKDSQLRDVLDPLPTDILKKIFSDYLNQLQRGKHLQLYQFSQRDVSCAAERHKGC